MKLRLQGNSLRVRVTDAEITQFREIGHLEETVVFGPTQHETLTYALIKAYAQTEITATLANNIISIYVPAEIAADWTHAAHHGFEARVPNGTEKGLKILVEKDLDCQH